MPKGVIIIEGREEFEEFVKKHCILIEDDYQYFGMTTIWTSDLGLLNKKLEYTLLKGNDNV